jgi:hypothetical protein
LFDPKEWLLPAPGAQPVTAVTGTFAAIETFASRVAVSTLNTIVTAPPTIW